MTSAARLSVAARSILPQSSYICLQCRLRASSALRTANASKHLPHDSRRYASGVDTYKPRKMTLDKIPSGPEDRSRKLKLREQEETNEQALEPVREEDLGEPEDGNEYIRATTANNLEEVGGPGWGVEEWKTENSSFKGFMKHERTDDRNGIVLAIHRALVEVYALRQEGLPLALDYYSENSTADYAKRVARGAKFEQAANGLMILVLESEELRHSILECVTPRKRDEDTMEETQITEPEIFEEGVESRGAEETPSEMVEEDDETNLESEDSEVPVLEDEPLDSAEFSDLAAFVPASDTWRDVSLDNAVIKFAVLKRVMQLTGRRIPDPDISVITTPKSLLVHLVKKPKPKRIADALLNSNLVTHLPNVQILNKRYTMIDREIEIGRWKVIKEELEKKHLPVPGNADSR